MVEVSRREFLRTSGLIAMLPLVSIPGEVSASVPDSKAKSVIQIWLWGGPSHLDTFDPKPNAGNDYTGELRKTLKTNVEGIEIGELLPKLAENADKYSLIRGMTHGINGHETASYITQTGRPSGGRNVFPGMGAVVSYFKGINRGYKGLIPPYIVLTNPQGRFAEEGFLGLRYKPFATNGDPNHDPFLVEGVVAQGISRERQEARRKFLENVNTLAHAMEGSSVIQESIKARDEAYSLILGKEGEVFDLSQESAEIRQKYGRNTFGQSCLAAKRLVEAGVPYITINYPGWDTHKSHFETMRRKLPELDNGLSSLLYDLSEHGLLDSTIVLCGGEFGRTPRVDWVPPWNGGRGHYGKAFSYLVAGGGFKGGHIVGATDKTGENVIERAVYPVDLIGSVYQLMGIDRNEKLPHPQGEIVHVLPRPEENVKSEGILKEIM